jgi:tetratricopeptide (TPR) repeat protein
MSIYSDMRIDLLVLFIVAKDLRIWPPRRARRCRPLDLLPLALARPNEALKRARTILAGDPGPIAASVARQAIGIVLREYGDIDAAVEELRIARRLARRAGSTSREADVLGTLGVTLIFAGRSASGRKALDAAVRQSTGHLHDRVLFRRGYGLLVLGRHREALEDLNAAVVAMRAADDQIWEARALQERAVSYLSSGSARRAIADLRRAEDLSDANGQNWKQAKSPCPRLTRSAARGFAGGAELFPRGRGPIPASWCHEPDLSIRWCAALAAAVQDAMHEAEAAIGSGRDSRSTDQAAELFSPGQVRAGRRRTRYGGCLGDRGA